MRSPDSSSSDGTRPRSASFFGAPSRGKTTTFPAFPPPEIQLQTCSAEPPAISLFHRTGKHGKLIAIMNPMRGLILAIWLAANPVFAAEYYRWVDDSGVLHITDNLHKHPRPRNARAPTEFKPKKIRAWPSPKSRSRRQRCAKRPSRLNDTETS